MKSNKAAKRRGQAVVRCGGGSKIMTVVLQKNRTLRVAGILEFRPEYLGK